MVRGGGKGRIHHTPEVVEIVDDLYRLENSALRERISAQLMPMKHHEDHRNPMQAVSCSCFIIVHTKVTNVFS